MPASWGRSGHGGGDEQFGWIRFAYTNDEAHASAMKTNLCALAIAGISANVATAADKVLLFDSPGPGYRTQATQTSRAKLDNSAITLFESLPLAPDVRTNDKWPVAPIRLHLSSPSLPLFEVPAPPVVTAPAK